MNRTFGEQYWSMQALCASSAIPPPAGCEIRTQPKKTRKNKQFRRARSLKRACFFSRLKNLMKNYPRLKALVQTILMRLMSRMRCDLMLDLRFVASILNTVFAPAATVSHRPGLGASARGACRSCVPAVSRVWFLVPAQLDFFEDS